MIEDNATSITHRDMVELWERRYQELMALPKEELVKMIIGSKEDVGRIFGFANPMEDTLSFEELATKIEPFEPPYTEEFMEYTQKSIDASRKAHTEAIRDIANIIITV